MNIRECISVLRQRNDCTINDPVGMPTDIQLNGFELTDELKELYTLCGGLEIAPEEAYGTDHGIILPPDSFLQADPVVASEDAVQMWKEEGVYDTFRSRSCFTLMDIGNGNFIVADLGGENRGRIYLAEWESYPIYDDVPIIANSLAEFLDMIIVGLDTYNDFYWNRDDYEPLGAAFE